MIRRPVRRLRQRQCAVELGQPMFWLITAVAVCSIDVLLQASLRSAGVIHVSGNGMELSRHIPTRGTDQLRPVGNTNRPEFWIFRRFDPEPLILTVRHLYRPDIGTQIIKHQIDILRAYDENEVMLA